MRRFGLPLTLALTLAATAHATPPTPYAAHPRLFMSAAELAGYRKNATTKGTAAAAIVAACQDTLVEPNIYKTRGGSDGNYWPGSAVNCAFAYLATKNAQYLTQALLYWQASLSDDQTIGDGLGCAPGVSTDWQSWNGTPPAPPVILTVSHDTDYPMRWYGPDIALTYDWLYSAPGVSSALLSQTRTCLTAWSDFYTAKGYHNTQAGANYNAGFVVAKTLSAVAIGTDGGADGHLWTEAITDIFEGLLIGQGLQGATDPIGQPAGAMAGGDWLEGWQYGPLSVLEYAVSARAIEEYGQPLPEMDAWTNSLAVRYIHGTVPTLDGQWVGGDFDSTQVYQSPTAAEVDAVLAGPSSDQAAAWAAYFKQTQNLSAGSFIYDAVAELRAVTPADYRAQASPPPLWYEARGSRAVYARTAWSPTAYWGVFSSPPHIVDDHEHLAAGNFVFSRGADHLIVDSSNYGEIDTFETNAVAADAGLVADYTPSQTPWSTAELTWARATTDAVYAARSDYATAFAFADTPTTIPYATRAWAMLPEGEVVTIDRLQLADATHYAYLHFHANTGGKLRLNGNVASGTVGSSTLAIHAVQLSGGTPVLVKPPVGSCTLSCSYPCGLCDTSRFTDDEYTVKVPGPWAVAIHVFDGLGSDSATVGSLNDTTNDPAPQQNGGVIGAAVLRGGQQSYVVANSTVGGAVGTTLMYAVLGTTGSRHIVYDAPEGADGSSTVTTATQNGRCAITITPSSASTPGFIGHPLIFNVASVAKGCTASDATDKPPATYPMTGGVAPITQTGSSTSTGTTSTTGTTSSMGTTGTESSHKSGCGCVGASTAPTNVALLLLALAALVGLRRRAD